MNIIFHYDQIKLRIRRAGETKKFLVKVISGENKKPGDLYFIFTKDEVILDINKRFLKHDFYTDVISFDYSDGIVINGEIYISIDTVKRNAVLYKTDFDEELMRVMIHGVLHLCGYNDGNKRDRDLMFKKQEAKLDEFKMVSE